MRGALPPASIPELRHEPRWAPRWPEAAAHDRPHACIRRRPNGAAATQGRRHMTDPMPEPTHAPLHTVSRGRARWHRGLIRPVLQRRSDVVPAAQAIAFVIGIAVALVAGALLLLAAGNDPAQVYGRMLDSSLGGINSISRTLLRATPLALAGLAVAVAGSMGLWNIGAEGQMMAGATVAAGLAMTAGDLPGPVLIVLMIGAGAVGGVVLMAGPALARAYLGVSEIITTLMLVEVSIRVVEWLETGPWKDPESQGFALIEPLPDQASLPGLFGRAHIGVLIAIALLVAFWLAVSRTAWGYELRMAGSSPATARYAGISLQRKVLTALVLSGALAGLAGAVELTGTATRLDPGLSNGYGFAGIIVAALALMRPSGVAAVAFVFGAVQVGGQSIQTLGVTSSIATILQAMILIGALVAAVLLNYRIRWVRPVGHDAEATGV
ncbi:MAG: ABC transporter permease [Acidimicrobiales bacterium]|nr:ABC transporter permease [Acidimicrobiales bacterium]MYD83581.1 ABC transporter permease [Acidimicrobiales bacterium]MYJ66826.1 ABC transporter permease [Acidimicrobiales bacterium]